ncbi:regulatory protein RecX [Aestuariimicrobium sp. T2.26MG-19.2B]|uniref:regulatory protein RecX n=1 Tax=Aestuariimicrobium sp. T2.26MG-19.2B TaxID=3040679 RepID=UPI00406C635B
MALRRLTLRAHSRHELAEAMRAKLVPGEIIDEVLDRFSEVQLIDDAAFAAAWSESRHRNRNLSRRVIGRELRAKGVSDDDTKQALDQITDEDELRSARQIAEKKARSLARLDPVVARRRLEGVLARRGYGPSVIIRVCREVLDADSDILGDLTDADGDPGPHTWN